MKIIREKDRDKENIVNKTRFRNKTSIITNYSCIES